MAFVSKLAWYGKRARVMSLRELLHRLGRLLDGQVLYLHWRFGLGLCRPTKTDPGRFRFCRATIPELPPLDWRMPDDWQEKSAARLDGQAAALGFPWRWTDTPEIWRQAPENDTIWPDSFYRKIDYRPGNRHGDIRVLWEPARLQHLIDLALLARAGRDDSATDKGGTDGSRPDTVKPDAINAADTNPDDANAAAAVAFIERQLVSWWRHNPPLTGPHYASVMECALRIIAVCHTVDLVRHRLPQRSPVWRLLPALVAVHAGLTARRLSLYSSRGNHTIAECVGLIYAGSLFPELKPAQDWLTLGKRWLVEEAARQILDDGGGIEQAFWYHLFVVDLAGLALRLLERQGDPETGALADAVSRGRRFLALWADRPDELPDIGDRDGGYALSPHLAISWPDEPPAERENNSVTRPDAGYTRIRLTKAPGDYLLFDHGPLGMAPGFGHGHADALSLVAVVGNRPVLIDPGTYGYGLELEWRRYFRGTAAHNTVSVDRQDQAIQETRFQWKAPGKAALVRLESRPDDAVVAIARFAGGTPDSWTHWRGLYCVRDKGFLVWDQVPDSGDRPVAAHWHLGLPARLDDAGDCCRLRLDDRRTMSVDFLGATAALLQGSNDPLSGWSAATYGVLSPIATLRAARKRGEMQPMITRFRLDGDRGPLPDEAAAIARIELESTRRNG